MHWRPPFIQVEIVVLRPGQIYKTKPVIERLSFPLVD